jgi:ribosomal protein S9
VTKPRGKSLTRLTGKTSPLPEKTTRNRTKVWKHPDRAAIEAMLVVRPAHQVERWLAERYADSPDRQVTRKNLIIYRNKYLVDEHFAEPIRDNPLDDVTPMRVPPDHPMWEFDSLTAQVQALEYIAAQAIEQDTDLGLVQETTIEALQALGKAIKDRAELAAKLGVPGYVEAAKRLQVEQQSVNVEVRTHAGLDALPDASKMEIARAMLGMSPEERQRLLSAGAPETVEVEDAVIEDD